MSTVPSTERPTRSPNPLINNLSAEERREHMRALARRSHEVRLQLSADERRDLAEAYRLLDRIYQRHAAKLERAVDGEAGDAT